MAGSYNHVVADDGNLHSNERIAASLENFGDIFEAVEEMYGMIWWLAADVVNYNQNAEIEADVTRRFTEIKKTVETARQNYKEGLRFALEIHFVLPDQRR